MQEFDGPITANIDALEGTLDVHKYFATAKFWTELEKLLAKLPVPRIPKKRGLLSPAEEARRLKNQRIRESFEPYIPQPPSQGAFPEESQGFEFEEVVIPPQPPAPARPSPSPQPQLAPYPGFTFTSLVQPGAPPPPVPKPKKTPQKTIPPPVQKLPPLQILPAQPPSPPPPSQPLITETEVYGSPSGYRSQPPSPPPFSPQPPPEGEGIPPPPPPGRPEGAQDGELEEDVVERLATMPAGKVVLPLIPGEQSRFLISWRFGDYPFLDRAIPRFFRIGSPNDVGPDLTIFKTLRMNESENFRFSTALPPQQPL